ncbi:hypothetical protein CCMA1212_002836 [Trichoderma ghanense]|uniref:Uncharacterized protein n=1 Tax=Trichoderma ghanense TaxID=65468 RepID=A0ABY2HCS6_9HYPO
MPQQQQLNDITTIFLILLFMVSLFPDAFHFIWTLPLSYIFSKPPSSPADTTIATMSWFQKQITLPAKSRGSYLITDQILSALPEIQEYKVGLLNLFVQHTSCALSLNENWDEDVRADMSDALDRIAPDYGAKGEALYRHEYVKMDIWFMESRTNTIYNSAEGPDDMPAHIKSALIGASVTIPIKDGKLATGTWQGIWYLEFRASKHRRNIIATIQGDKGQKA